MKSPIAKLAAAAVIIAAVILSINILDKSVAPAYAIDQTIEANKEMRYIHVRSVSPPAPEPQDIWIEFNDNGEVIALHLEEGLEKSFRIMVWANDTIYWYSPPKNEFVIQHEVMRGEREIEEMSKGFDPKYAVELLKKLQLEGKMEINIESSINNDEPIRLTATATTMPIQELYRLPGGPKQVLLVDPDTKLAVRRDSYELKDGKYELYRSLEFLEYNKPIDPQMFILEPPKGVKLEDRTKGIGMPQGKLTDEEAAAEVVKQYIEALIAKDYAKAGRLYNGKPADELRERVEEKVKIKHLRVIGIGKPVPEPQLGERSFGVPFADLIETSDGRKEIDGPPGGKAWTEEAEANLDIQSHRQAIVRPVVGQPDRWVITGGI